MHMADPDRSHPHSTGSTEQEFPGPVHSRPSASPSSRAGAAIAPTHACLIIGGGQAGAQAALSLRQLGFTGSLAILTEETDPPYQRPPLSKAYLAGDQDADSLMLRPASLWPQRQIDLHLGARVVAVDAEAHRVRTAAGQSFGYARLIWAAGGHARKLSCPGADLPCVHTLRTRADADRIRATLATASRIVIIGGGYIGLEVAAVLTSLGKKITLVEMADRLLARVTGTALAAFYARQHRARGVDILLHANVTGITPRAGGGCTVHLGTGMALPADQVIVGIGIVPAVAPLRAAGAAGENGVDIDPFCRTSLPDIYAIGDCAAHVSRFTDGARRRLESVQNATDQAIIAARSILGQPVPYDAVPWFWSNQYDLTLQTVGLSQGADTEIMRGDPHADRLTIAYLRQGRLIALDCVNTPRDFAQGKALIAAAARPDPRKLADPETPLKAS